MGGMNERMNGIGRWMSKWMEWVGWMSKWMEWDDEWVNEWVNERNGGMNE